MVAYHTSVLHPKDSLFEGQLIMFVGGFTMLMTQVVLLRELAALYVLNELIVGVFLSFWLLFAGLGALFGHSLSRFEWHVAGFFPLLSGILALVSLWLLYGMRRWWMPMGVVPGLFDWMMVACGVTFVFCFLSGLMFTWFSGAISLQMNARQTEWVYVSEQTGSLFAGVLFYLFSQWWMNAFWVMTLLLAINLFLCLFLWRSPGVTVNVIRIFVVALLLGGLVVLPQYDFARGWVHGRLVKKSFFSPYGSIDVLGDNGDSEIFGSGRFLSYHLLVEEREELLHPALLLHPQPRRLLLINSAPGIVSEALRYDSLHVYVVSPDKAFIDLEKEMLGNQAGASRVHFIQVDPFFYLSHRASELFDVVVVGGGVPYTLAGNRFCTRYFYSLVQQNLRSDGILMTGGLAYTPFSSATNSDMLRVFYSTLTGVFSQVKIWAGNRIFFVGSNEPLASDWWSLHPLMVSENRFVNPDFFPDYLLEGQVSGVGEIVARPASENNLIRPVLFGLALKDLSDFWEVSLWWFVAIFGGLFFGGLLFFRGVSSGVFLSGFALGGMQGLLLLFWQMVRGDMFRATGLLFSLFMAGLALGAWVVKKFFPNGRGAIYPIGLVVLALLALSAVPVLNSMGDSFGFPIGLSVWNFLLAFLGGAIFAFALALQSGRVIQSAALIYGADVAGGAIGSFVVVVLLVPFTGLLNAGYLVGMTLLLGALVLWKKLD